MNPDPHTRPGARRVGDDERNACADLLAMHRARGRLTQEDFEERLAVALTAQHTGEIGRILSDLPAATESSEVPRTRAEKTIPGRYEYVGGGLLLLGLSWVMIVSTASDTWPLIAAFVANGVGIIATLLVARGVRGPATRRANPYDR